MGPWMNPCASPGAGKASIGLGHTDSGRWRTVGGGSAEQMGSSRRQTAQFPGLNGRLEYEQCQGQEWSKGRAVAFGCHQDAHLSPWTSSSCLASGCAVPVLLPMLHVLALQLFPL